MTSPSSLLPSSPAPKGLAKSQIILKYVLQVIKYIKDAGREARSDLSARWAHGLCLFYISGLIIGIIFVGVFYGLRGLPSTACHPDGTFSVYLDYSYWDITGFFQVNIGFGRLTFTQAKVIDTAWEIVVGRITQSILAFFLWRTITHYATVSMETKPTTYAVFLVLFLQEGPSFLSIGRLLRDFVRHGGFRSKLSTIWILLSMIFVLAWPTLIAAMSGYTPETDAYVQDMDGNLVKFTEFQLLSYIIHDGWRVGLEGDYPVPYGPNTGGKLITLIFQFSILLTFS
ncbi:hypothetical protein F4859DRAFT_508675 [Xylaria cf. heliscus]|nr:hypothetical protein F4859DRAFT_508675 [Xylaria cf. heliscus]